MSFSRSLSGAEKSVLEVPSASGCFGVASLEYLARQLMTVLLIAMSEVAATPEVHLLACAVASSKDWIRA